MQELHQECAYDMLRFLVDMRKKPYPVKPPEILNYLETKRTNPKFAPEDKFWKQDHIIAYFNNYKCVFADNNGNLYWLQFIADNLMPGDTINLGRVIDALHTHGVAYEKKKETAEPQAPKEAVSQAKPN